MDELPFQVGDLVRIKSKEELVAEFGDEYGRIIIPSGFNTRMEYMCDQIVKVKSIERHTSTRYTFRTVENIEHRDAAFIDYWALDVCIAERYEDISSAEVSESDWESVLLYCEEVR